MSFFKKKGFCILFGLFRHAAMLCLYPLDIKDKRYCTLFGGPLLIGSGAIELVLRFRGLQKQQCFLIVLPVLDWLLLPEEELTCSCLMKCFDI